MKNQKWTFVKTALITYLAASKILYWIDAASDMMQADIGGARIAILFRIIGRDLPLVLAVIGFVFIHKSKGRLWLKLIVGYVATITILFSYLFIMEAIGRIYIASSYLSLFTYYSVSYAVINVVLLGKDFLKRRAKTEEISLLSSESEDEAPGSSPE
ncbi:MAG: hypothetical protein FWC73_13735 [Defluviitaleaceae bacterium]|nr:hypothetical protein [Defluviitaleaceae bacterium]